VPEGKFNSNEVAGRYLRQLYSTKYMNCMDQKGDGGMILLSRYK